jgi:hypothetical protein
VTTALLTGYALASIHVAVVLFVVFLILFGAESDWPMYWCLPMLTSIPFSLVVIWAVQLFCKRESPLRAPLSESDLRDLNTLQHRSLPEHDSGGNGRLLGAAWSRAANLENFLLPLVLFGVGGALWWLLLPSAIVAAYRALV